MKMAEDLEKTTTAPRFAGYAHGRAGLAATKADAIASDDPKAWWRGFVSGAADWFRAQQQTQKKTANE